MSATSSRLRRATRDLMPRRGAWWLIAGACVVGALLFLALWAGRPDVPASTGADPATPAAADGLPIPLPAPLPAGETGASGIGYPPPLPPADPTPPVPKPAPAPLQPPLASAPPVDALPAATAPRPRSMPAPDYPRAALRRGESGEVLLRVHVGANGRTGAVDIVRSSGSARLDQAAASAVRRWRFEPATRDGQAVAGQVQVPIAFAPGGG